MRQGEKSNSLCLRWWFHCLALCGTSLTLILLRSCLTVCDHLWPNSIPKCAFHKLCKLSIVLQCCLVLHNCSCVRLGRGKELWKHWSFFFSCSIPHPILDIYCCLPMYLAGRYYVGPYNFYSSHSRSLLLIQWGCGGYCNRIFLCSRGKYQWTRVLRTNH